MIARVGIYPRFGTAAENGPAESVYLSSERPLRRAGDPVGPATGGTTMEDPMANTDQSRRITTRAGALLATFGACAALPAAAQQDMFVLVRGGSDTISVERFTRTDKRLEAELLVKAQGVRLAFAGDLGPGVTMPSFENRFWLATDDPKGTPRQSATFSFRSDSVIVEISGGGQNMTQRLGTTPGALPHINPSFSLMELAVVRARAGKPDVPFFAVSGGQTFTITVKPAGPDSVLLTGAGGDARVRVDSRGRIMGGVIPSQNLTIIRVAADAEAMKVEKPDYSAPPGAPYTAVEVSVPTPMGHRLAGTLTIPAGASAAARVPAVVTITGSGSQDRDEAIAIFKGYRLFRDIADSLGRRGIAVLRMDDRGFGGSGGNAATATSADFADDIAAGLAYLRTRPEIDGRRLGLVGHSEGGMIAPMVAARDPSLAGIVLLAGPAYNGRDILLFQLGNIAKNDTSRKGAARDSAIRAVPAQVDSMIATSPWLRFFATHDPIATARRVKTPVLIVNGERDLQVTAEQVPLLEAAFKSAGNTDVTTRVFPNLNHLFVYDPDGTPSGYASLPSLAVSRDMIGLVADWLAKRLVKPAS